MQKTVTKTIQGRKWHSHRYFAHLGDTPGTADCVPGGFVYQAEGTSTFQLLAHAHPALVLLGRWDVIEAQRLADAERGC
jgi:hypothetical protein